MLKTKIRALWRYVMFRITYSYFRKDNNGKLIGSPIIKHVDGKTLKQVNDTFNFIRYNHDVSRCSIINFMEVEEIKEH